MSDQFSKHLGGIMCYKFTLKNYQRQPKAAKRSIKAIFKRIQYDWQKKLILNVCWALNGKK